MDFRPHIELVLGPMYSGKTSELIRRLRRFGHAKKSIVVIKYSRDTRYSDNECSSHDKVMVPAKPATALLPLLSEISKYDCIGIDEGQFFPDVVEFAEAVASTGKVVIISALDGDFMRRPFGRILELVPLAEKVCRPPATSTAMPTATRTRRTCPSASSARSSVAIDLLQLGVESILRLQVDKLTAVCSRCCADACYTHRTVASTQIVLIGGAESYVPLCRACYSAATGQGLQRVAASSPAFGHAPSPPSFASPVSQKLGAFSAFSPFSPSSVSSTSSPSISSSRSTSTGSGPASSPIAAADPSAMTEA